MRGFVRFAAIFLVATTTGLGGLATAAEVRSPGVAPNLVVQAPTGDSSEDQGDLAIVSVTKGAPPVLILTVKTVAVGARGAQSAALMDKVAAGIFSAWAKAGSATVGPTADGAIKIGGLPASRYRGAITVPNGPTEAIEIAVIRIDDNHLGCLILVGNPSQAGTGALEKAMLAATLTGG